MRVTTKLYLRYTTPSGELRRETMSMMAELKLMLPILLNDVLPNTRTQKEVDKSPSHVDDDAKRELIECAHAFY